MKKALFITTALITQWTYAQRLGINTAEPQATLDIVDNNAGHNKGIIFPQLTSNQIKAMAAPEPGQIVYNTTLNCLMLYSGETYKLDSITVPQWRCKSNAPAGGSGRMPRAKNSNASINNMLNNASAFGGLLPNRDQKPEGSRSSFPAVFQKTLDRRNPTTR